jgi:serine/threonine protein kinase
VLVDGAEQPKIADFGLSRDLEREEFYQPANANAKLPLRWCAPEVLNGLKFSEASDVWSYGVVIDEVYNRGAFPYPGWDNNKVMQMVENGYRLPQAQGCPDLVYETIMKGCLHKQPHARPKFGAICAAFNNIKSQKSLRISGDEPGRVRFKTSVKRPYAPPNKPGQKLGLCQEVDRYLSPVPLDLQSPSSPRSDSSLPRAGATGDMADYRSSISTSVASDAELPYVDLLDGQEAADRPSQWSISSTLESDAVLPYVDLVGANGSAPDTTSEGTPTATIITRVAPKMLELAYAPPDFVGDSDRSVAATVADVEKEPANAPPEFIGGSGDAGGKAWMPSALRQRSNSYDTAMDTLGSAPDNLELPNTPTSENSAASLSPGKTSFTRSNSTRFSTRSNRSLVGPTATRSPPSTRSNRSSVRSNPSSTKLGDQPIPPILSNRASLSQSIGPDYQQPPPYEDSDHKQSRVARVGNPGDPEPLRNAGYADIASQDGSTLPTSSRQPNPDPIHYSVEDVPPDIKQRRESDFGYGIVLTPKWRDPR